LRICFDTARQRWYAPTYNQDEVLIRGRVLIDQIHEIVVPSERARKVVEDILLRWSATRSPRLRIEERMFLESEYWRENLFAERLPVLDED